MPPTVALVNQKGGVGKTSVTLGLASAAWAAGDRVLGHLAAEEQQPCAAHTERERADRRREPIRSDHIACHRQ